MYTLIFANGDPNDGPAVRDAIDSAVAPRLVIAVDGGTKVAQFFGVNPHLIIGDLDSVEADAVVKALTGGAEIVQFPTAKDETDLELALMTAVMRNSNPIRLIGAIGGRLDHMLANIYLLALPDLHDRDVRMVSGAQTAWLAYPGITTVTGQVNDTVSLIPLAGDVVGVKTDNMAYPLHEETLRFGPARGISNVLTSPQASVTFKSGLLLIVHTIGTA